MKELIKRILISPFNLIYTISPKIATKILFRLKQGHKLDLNNPKTYNEKINWIKLNYENDLMPICADKYTVRQYVIDCGCGEILNELLWQGYNAKNIPFEKLPNRFVIKVTHGSGLNIICKNKKELDKKRTVKKLNKWLEKKYIPCYGEWFYGVIKPRIIIESFLSENNNEVPKDYKLFCFNNVNGQHDVGLTVVDINRMNHHKRQIFDNKWDLVPGLSISFPNEKKDILEKPNQYEKMIHYAKVLSTPFPHARVDFYVINNKIYFGEITLTNGAGFAKIKPHNKNEMLGSWINLKL